MIQIIIIHDYVYKWYLFLTGTSANDLHFQALRVYQGGTGTENWQRSTRLTQPQPPHMILNWALQLINLARVYWEESSIQTSEAQISTLVLQKTCLFV